MNNSSNSTDQQFNNNNNRGGTTTRLSNPTAYHMQQMRYKEAMGIDPSQMMGNAHLIFAQQQQQLQHQQQLQQDSPNLSDLDYSELANSSPMTGEFQPSARYRQKDEYIFDEEQAKQQQYAYAIQMKRSSTEIDGGMVGHHQHYNNKFQQQPGYYPSSSFENDNGIHSSLKQFAGSAPSNMGYHGGGYSSFAGSDDMISVAASQSTNFTSSKRGAVDDNASANHELLDDSYVEDYSNQAK
jgi:hypothetical protein